mmetsp:Transcript_17376/g.29976  ORF Transcript_17376/g.29976 Transcript_17376/m.29976 type:complete len:97 (+) Transcript_17376:639-929(+)
MECAGVAQGTARDVLPAMAMSFLAVRILDYAFLTVMRMYQEFAGQTVPTLKLDIATSSAKEHAWSPVMVHAMGIESVQDNATLTLPLLFTFPKPLR